MHLIWLSNRKKRRHFTPALSFINVSRVWLGEGACQPITDEISLHRVATGEDLARLVHFLPHCVASQLRTTLSQSSLALHLRPQSLHLFLARSSRSERQTHFSRRAARNFYVSPSLARRVSLGKEPRKVNVCL